MGARGPLPKRAIERRRRNASGDVDTVRVIGKVAPPPFTARDLQALPLGELRALARERGIKGSKKAEIMPALVESLPVLHPIALFWLQALRDSAHVVYYEPSDWAYAVVAADFLTKQIKKRSVSAEGYATWSSMATNLLTTEGARRRVHIEIERLEFAPPDDGKVTDMQEARDRLSRPPDGFGADDEDDDDGGNFE